MNTCLNLINTNLVLGVRKSDLENSELSVNIEKSRFSDLNKNFN